jgi:hypothetical protein
MQEKDWFENPLFHGIAWTVLSCYVVVQILASFGAPLSYDRAIPLVAADLMLHGRKAAVDFWSFYPPLYYYLILAGFRSVGRSALVPTFFAAVMYVVLLVAVGRFFWKSFPHLRSLAPLIIFPTVIAVGGFIIYPPWPGYAVSFLSLLAYISSRNGPLPDKRWIALAGLLAGLSTLIRFNFGPYVLLVACSDILVHAFVSETSIPSTVRLKHSLVQISILVMPFAVTIVTFYAWIYGIDAVAAPVRMIKYSMSVMGVRAFEHFGPSLRTLSWLGFPCAWMGVRNVLYGGKLRSAALIAGVGATLMGVGLLAGGMPSISLWIPALGIVSILALHLFVYRMTRPALCVLLFYVCLQHYYLSRAEHDHELVLYPVVAFSLIYLLEAPTAVEKTRVSFLRRPIFAVFLALVLFEVAFRDGFHSKVRLAATTLGTARLGVLSPGMPDRRRLLLIDSGLSDEIQSTEFVRQRTSPSEPIFIGVNDHSMPFVNHVDAYWLAERPPGARYINLDSCVMVDESVQKEIIAELQGNGVNWAILYTLSGDYDSWFQNLPPAPKALDNFLATQFRKQAQFGRFSVIRRR